MDILLENMLKEARELPVNEAAEGDGRSNAEIIDDIMACAQVAHELYVNNSFIKEDIEAPVDDNTRAVDIVANNNLSTDEKAVQLQNQSQTAPYVGYIYIIINDGPLFDKTKQWCKIGYADDVQARLKQFNQATETTKDWKVFAQFKVTGRLYDLKIHDIIDIINPSLRVSPNREFYYIAPADAVNMISAIAAVSKDIGPVEYVQTAPKAATPAKTTKTSKQAVGNKSIDAIQVQLLAVAANALPGVNVPAKPKYHDASTAALQIIPLGNGINLRLIVRKNAIQVVLHISLTNESRKDLFRKLANKLPNADINDLERVNNAALGLKNPQVGFTIQVDDIYNLSQDKDIPAIEQAIKECYNATK